MSSTQRAYRALRELIIRGGIAPGERLNTRTGDFLTDQLAGPASTLA